MTTIDRLTQVKRQVEQTKHRRILEENRVRDSQRKTDDRRKYIIGTLFCKHFPIALEIPPGSSTEEDRLNFEPLDNFMEALAKCQECYQEMEDALLENQ